MKKVSLVIIAILGLISFKSAAEHPKLNLERVEPSAVHAAQREKVIASLITNSNKAGGIKPLSADVIELDVAFYVHPFYFDQALISTKFDSSTPEDGGNFVIKRVNSFVEEMNNGLEKSNINARVKLKFIAQTGAAVPILSSGGASSHTMPDGITTVNTDAEFFELLMQDWGTDQTRYGISSNTLTRRIRAATQADLHIFIRPHFSEDIISAGYATPLIDSYPAIYRPLFDGPVGHSFEFGTMTIYDFYWQLGFQSFDPTLDYIKRIATNKLGAVLGGADEFGKAGGPAHARATTCGSGRTVMHSTLTINTLPFFSSPSLFFEGQPCGSAIGTANQADNRSVVNSNFVLMSSAAEPTFVDSTYSFAEFSEFLRDGRSYGFVIKRTGDLTSNGFVTVYAEGTTSREGYRNRINGEMGKDYDFHMGVQTVEFLPGAEFGVANLYVPARSETTEVKQLTVKIAYAANGTISKDASQLNLVILPNKDADKVEQDFVSLESTGAAFLEGDIARIKISRTNEFDNDIQVNVSARDLTAKQGVNFNLITSSVEIGRNDNFASIEIQIVDDGKYERNQQFEISLASENASIPSPTMIVKIDEVSEPIIGQAKPKVELLVANNAMNAVVVRLERFDGDDAEHRFRLEAEPGTTLVEGVDFDFGGIFEFGHRVTEGAISINLLGDKLGTINYSVFSENLQVKTGFGSVEIQKSESLPVVAVSTNVTVNENSGFAPIIINRDDASKEVTLKLRYVNGTAQANTDFKNDIQEFILRQGVASTTLEIPIIDRAQNGSDREFSVVFSSDQVTLPVNTTRVLIKDVPRNNDKDDKKIDNYAGSFNLISLLLLLLPFIRRIPSRQR